MIKIKPLHNFIVVKRHSSRDIEVSDSGIILPGSAGIRNEGTIVAIGPGKFDEEGKRNKMGSKVGDTIRFTPKAGIPYKEDDEEYLFMVEDDIVAVLE